MSGIVWIASYPRSGNTWFRTLLTHLRLAGPESTSIYRLAVESFPARDVCDPVIGWRTSELTAAEVEALRRPAQDALAARPGSTFYKTHDRFRDPQTGQALISAAATRCAVYLVRNPLDVVVSLAHRKRLDFDAAVRFLNDPAAALDSPPNHPALPQPLGDWSSHVTAWADASEVRVHVVRYEDLLDDTLGTFAAACRFAGLSCTPVEIERAAAHSDFAALQNEEKTRWADTLPPERLFFRQARRDAWRTSLQPRQVAAIVERHRATMIRFGYLSPSGDLPG